jgi:hypothetical protein
MKIRQGFVSNSSSSSFILASKKDLTKSEIKALLLSDPKIISNLVDKIVDTMVERLYSERPTSLREYALDRYGESNEQIARWHNKGLNFVYHTFFSDEDGDPIESLVCNALDINIETDEFAIEKESGY